MKRQPAASGQNGIISGVPMETLPKSPRKFQFSLRTMLFVTTLASVVLGVTWKEIDRHRRAMRAAGEISTLGGSVHWNPEVYETLYYDQALTRITDVHFSNPSFPLERWLVLQELPQRFGLQVEGPEFGDASLKYLKHVPNLKYLVLTNTSVSEAGVFDLKRALPDVSVMYGYPGDPGFREIR
jgi:hypothetical protein